VWQTEAGCSNRANNDVSAVADPNTGVWVYDSYGGGTWGIFGGTSVATPIIGSMYALAGNAASTTAINSLPYADPGALNDVISGSNGSCSVAILCNGEVGYDAPSGLGTPNGVAAFSTGPVVPPPPPPPPPPVAPSAPTNLTVTGGNGVVNLSWSAPLSNGGSPILGYDIYRGTSPGGESTTPLTASLVTPTTYADTTVANGTKYYYVVTAVNAKGPSTISTEASATPSAVTHPGAPSNLTATGRGSRRSAQVALSWSAPTSNGGSAIKSYTIYRSTTSGQETAYTTVACTTSSCSYTDSSVSYGTTYYYEVAATNGVGTGPDSNQASAKAG
jgi:hypothetical protein